MLTLKGKNVFYKIWYVLRTYILTLKRFDLFLQGSLLIIILLEANAMLLLRRDAGTGKLKSLLEDWVLIGVAVAEFVFGSILAWGGRSNRHFSLSGCLLATAVCSLLVLAVPYQHVDPPFVGLCGGDTISAYTDALPNIENDLETDSLATYRIILLILTVLLCSLTTISIWAHGLTYLDDHEPQNGPYFYGILISIRLSLGLSGKNWLVPGALRDDWWKAHLSLSMLVLMFAVLFTLFPKRMPQWRKIDVTDDTGFFTSLMRMIRNKALNLQILALSLLDAGLFGFVTYDKEYVQARFNIEAIWTDPRTSRAVSDIFRALVVVFFIMIFRVRFSDRRSDGVKANTAARVGGVVALFVAVFFCVIAVLHCNTDDIAGLEDGLWQQPQCSWECGCDSSRYGFTPVCFIDTSTTYFSPCSAGCKEYEDLNGLLLFHNCTCAAERVVRGSCSLPSCRTAFSIYQVVFTVMVAVSGASMLMQGMVILRVVQRWDKPIAQGLALSTVSILANVPGHILYMAIGYFTCAYAGNDGIGCVFHRPSLWWAAATSAVLVFLSALVSLYCSRVCRETAGGLCSLEPSISLDD